MTSLRDSSIPTPSQGLGRLIWIVLITLLALGCFSFWPALQAGFIGDDFQLLAQAKLVQNPLIFFAQNHSLSYFYRPMTMSLWWLSVHGLGEYGAQARTQYLLQMLLHLINALLLFVLCLRLSSIQSQRARPDASAVHNSERVKQHWSVVLVSGSAAIFFVTSVIGIGTSVWLADRFDLMASMGVLWLLILSQREILLQIPPMPDAPHQPKHTQRFSWPLGLYYLQIVAAACLAAFSKEVAVAALPAICLCFAYSTSSMRRRVILIAISTLPFVLMLSVRFALIRDVHATTGMEDSYADVVRGTRGWLNHFPAALSGGGGFTIPVMTLLFALGLGSIYHWRLAPQLAALFSILIAAALLQSPVTMNALISANALDNPANLRFYYLALIAFLPALVLLINQSTLRGNTKRSQRVRFISISGASALLCIGAFAQISSARSIASAWAGASAKVVQSRIIDSAVFHLRQHAAQLDQASPCVVQLLGTQADAPFFAGFSDVIIKSALNRDESAFNCIVLTEQAPWYQLVRDPDQLPAVLKQARVEFGKPLEAQKLDGLTYLFLRIELSEALLALKPFRLRWNGQEFLPFE